MAINKYPNLAISETNTIGLGGMGLVSMGGGWTGVAVPVEEHGYRF